MKLKRIARFLTPTFVLLIVWFLLRPSVSAPPPSDKATPVSIFFYVLLFSLGLFAVVAQTLALLALIKHDWNKAHIAGWYFLLAFAAFPTLLLFPAYRGWHGFEFGSPGPGAFYAILVIFWLAAIAAIPKSIRNRLRAKRIG